MRSMGRTLSTETTELNSFARRYKNGRGQRSLSISNESSRGYRIGNSSSIHSNEFRKEVQMNVSGGKIGQK